MDNELRRKYKETKNRYKNMKRLEKKLNLRNTILFSTLMAYRELMKISREYYRGYSVKEWNKIDKKVRDYLKRGKKK